MEVPPDLRCRSLGPDVVMLEWTPRSSPIALSFSERGVAVDILGGLTNEEIARGRNVAVRTVANQVAALFKKLGVSSRSEMAARFTATDLLR